MPGIAGLGTAVTGGYFMWRSAPQPVALGFLAAAMLLFALDAALETLSIAGIGGIIALTYGFTRMFIGARRISPLWAISAGVALGTITTALNWTGRRARRNKRAF